MENHHNLSKESAVTVGRGGFAPGVTPVEYARLIFLDVRVKDTINSVPLCEDHNSYICPCHLWDRAPLRKVKVRRENVVMFGPEDHFTSLSSTTHVTAEEGESQE
jgi:hypothetical protein